MQVRIANRQDEPQIRSFVDAIYQTSGRSLNLESEDSDLRNIEANYFGKEGLFLVAEEEGKISGIAGARKKSETVLELRRLMIEKEKSSSEIVQQLMQVIVGFAPRLLYERIDTELMPTSQEHDTVLQSVGFAQLNGASKSESGSDGKKPLSLSVTPDF